MDAKSLITGSLEDVLERVQGLQTVADAGQVRSFLAVPVRCTIDIATQLGYTAAGLHDVKVQLQTKVEELNGNVTALTSAIKSAATESSKQAGAMLAWSKALVVVTIVYTVVTAFGILARPRSPAPPPTTAAPASKSPG